MIKAYLKPISAAVAMALATYAHAEISAPPLKLQSNGPNQVSCDPAFDVLVCNYEIRWTPVASDLTKRVCEAPLDSDDWNCNGLGYAYSSRPGYDDTLYLTTHQPYVQRATEQAPPPVMSKRYKLQVINPTTGEMAESTPLPVYFLQPYYLKRDGLYFDLPTSGVLKIFYDDNGKPQDLFEVINANTTAGNGTAIYTTALGLSGKGSVQVNGSVVTYSPPAKSDPTAINRFQVTIQNQPIAGQTVVLNKTFFDVILVPRSGAPSEPVEFKAIPDTAVSANLQEVGNRYVYTPTGLESSRTVFTNFTSNSGTPKFAIIQTSGSFCPMFSNWTEARSYLDETWGADRACLVQWNAPDAPGGDPAEGLVAYPRQYVSNQWEQYFRPDLTSYQAQPHNLVTAEIVRTATDQVGTKVADLSSKVSVVVRTPYAADPYAVAQTVIVPYSVNVATANKYTVTSSANLFPELYGFLLVDSKTTPAFEYVVGGGDPAFLKIEGTNYMPQSLGRFEYDSLTMTATDSRLPGFDQSTKVSRYVLNVTKETIPVSVSNRALNGTMRVLVNSSRVATGQYQLTLKRVSAETGETTISPLNELIKVGAAPTAVNVAYNASNPMQNRTLDETNRVADITLPSDVIDDLLATGDRLYFEAVAFQPIGAINAKKFIDARPDLFIDEVPINGFTGIMTPIPSATVGATNLYSIVGKTASASVMNKKNVNVIQWIITPEKGDQIITDKAAPSSYDLTNLAPGTYQIAAKLYAGYGNEVATTEPIVFTQYAQPTVTFAFQDKVAIGDPLNLTALVTNVPPDAVATWKVGNRTIPGTVSADGKTITGQYVGAAAALNQKVTLTIQLNPSTFDAMTTLEAGAKVTVYQTLNPDIATTSKVFWATKGGTFTYKGNTPAAKLDWIVTNLDTGVETTKKLTDSGPYSTASLPEGRYSIRARAYDTVGNSALTGSLEFKVLLEPKATIKVPLSIPAGSTLPLTANTVNVKSTAIATWNIGDQAIPGTIDTNAKTITAVYNAGLVANAAKSNLTIQVDPENSDSIKVFDIGVLKTVAYGKLNAQVDLPKYLDVGTTATYKALVKAPWDTKVLPLNEDTMITEWELPDGSRVPGSILSYTPTMADYKLYTAGKRPIFRAWMVADKEDTVFEYPTNVPMYEPWVFPKYSLVERAGGATVVSPATVTLQAVPTPSVEASMKTFRGISYEWTLPQGSGLTSVAKKETVTLTINEPGTYPLSLRVFDRYGADQVLNYTIEAIKPQFSIDKVAMLPTPETGRVPVKVVLRPATSSTHKKDRLKSFDTYADGILIGTGQAPKVVTFTEPGTHDITLVAHSTLGNEATRSQTFTAIPNQAPVCSAFKVSYGTAGKIKTAKANALCYDPDGKIKKYAWTVNGVPMKSISATQVYGFQDTETTAEFSVTVTDDSGGSTVYTETVYKQ